MYIQPATLGAALVLAVVLIGAGSTPAPAAPGLTGAYYLPSSGGYSIDEDGLPVPAREPDATRVDAQIAFGEGKGFTRTGGKKQFVWWMPERDGQVAVVWKGYVRLPRAGTYYFATVSDDGSAVYLNQSRVALNGDLGYYIESPAFRYPAAKPAPHPSRRAYVVPVPVDGARVLPIEVRYVARNISGVGFGIDLYWVTPDAKRDDTGRPIAEIVPASALFTEPPAAVALARVSRAHSTLSSDFLYFPDEGAATLTVRLADAQGRPVAGRRVHISGVTSYGTPDAITQPEKPTDANGVTTATVKGQRTNHVSTFFATDLTGLVDAGQAAEMTMRQEKKVSFLPPAFSPYYDGKHFKLSPTPLRVGQRASVSVPVTNRQKMPAELRVRLLQNPPNIGLRDWTKIAESASFVLKPGETRVVELAWTPTEALPHFCFKVQVWGSTTRGSIHTPWFALPSAYAAPPAEGAAYGKLLEERQQNIGPVTRAIVGPFLVDQIFYHLRERHDRGVKQKFLQDWKDFRREWYRYQESGGLGPPPPPPRMGETISDEPTNLMRIYRWYQDLANTIGGPEKKGSIASAGKA